MQAQQYHCGHFSKAATAMVSRAAVAGHSQQFTAWNGMFSSWRTDGLNMCQDLKAISGTEVNRDLPVPIFTTVVLPDVVLS